MPRTHRPYDPNFRQQAVDLLLTSGKTQRQVARDLGLCVETLRAWRRQHEGHLPVPPVHQEPRPALELERENQRLRQELAYVQRQRDILKKALAICSAQPELLDASS